MSHHLICLTIDTDPDGLSGKEFNRDALEWRGLEQALDLSSELAEREPVLGGRVPLTWFVRADGHLRTRLGSTTFLLECYSRLWEREAAQGDELAWHPHLYKQGSVDGEVRLITDKAEACDELVAIWEDLRRFCFAPTGFRNGEAWHYPETMNLVEELGFSYDSSAVPGRCSAPSHPLDWRTAPNEPFFPAPNDIRNIGAPRALLEVPMNTWRVKAPWDDEPRLRYMNPATHSELFDESLILWRDQIRASARPLYVWVLVIHPDEIMGISRSDGLIAHSRAVLYENLERLVTELAQLEHTWEFVTTSAAAQRWREQPVFSP